MEDGIRVSERIKDSQEEKKTSQADNNNKNKNMIAGLDLEKMQNLIIKAYDELESAIDKEIDLVIGLTGSGKSTLINYLIENKIIEDELGHAIIDPEQVAIFKETNKKYPIIGHGGSETFYPKIYESNGIAFCDCPGFDETRGKEEEILTSINTEMVINLAKNIRSIVVVMEASVIDQGGRGKSLEGLCNILSKLLRNPKVISKSALFVITKCEERETKNRIILKINNKIAELKNKIKKNKTDWQNNPSEEGAEAYNRNKAKVQVLKLMQQSSIALARVYDNGDCRNEIFNQLKTRENLAKGMFDFSNYEESRSKFNQVILQIATEGICLLRHKRFLSKRIELLKDGIEGDTANIEFQEVLNKSITDVHDLESINNQINELKKSKEENDKKINENDKFIAKYTNSINELKATLTAMNVDVLIPWRTQKLNTQNDWEGWLPLFFWNYKKEFNYDDIPFQEAVVKYNKGASFDVKSNNPKGGKYEAVYTYDGNGTAEAEVVYQIKNGDKPEIKAEVQRVNNILAEKEELLTYFQYVHDEAKKKKESIDDQIKNLESGTAMTLEKEKKVIASTKNAIQRDLENKIKQGKDCRVELEACEKTIASQQHLYRTVNRIASCIDFKNKTLDEFLHAYSASLEKNIKDYDDEDMLDSCRCPITLQLMEFPVFLDKCGHTFEHRAIYPLMKKDEKEGGTCPCCREPLKGQRLINNVTLKRVISEYKEKKEQELQKSMRAEAPSSTAPHSSYFSSYFKSLFPQSQENVAKNSDNNNDDTVDENNGSLKEEEDDTDLHREFHVL